METTTPQDRTTECTVPDGAPPWITPELLADTVATWERISGKEITVEQAVELVISFAQLHELLQEESQQEDQR